MHCQRQGLAHLLYRLLFSFKTSEESENSRCMSGWLFGRGTVYWANRASRKLEPQMTRSSASREVKALMFCLRPKTKKAVAKVAVMTQACSERPTMTTGAATHHLGKKAWPVINELLTPKRQRCRSLRCQQHTWLDGAVLQRLSDLGQATGQYAGRLCY